MLSVISLAVWINDTNGEWVLRSSLSWWSFNQYKSQRKPPSHHTTIAFLIINCICFSQIQTTWTQSVVSLPKSAMLTVASRKSVARWLSSTTRLQAPGVTTIELAEMAERHLPARGPYSWLHTKVFVRCTLNTQLKDVKKSSSCVTHCGKLPVLNMMMWFKMTVKKSSCELKNKKSFLRKFKHQSPCQDCKSSKKSKPCTLLVSYNQIIYFFKKRKKLL